MVRVQKSRGDADGVEDDDDSRRLTGTVKSYSAEQGYGFLTSREALERFGRDVFLHSKHVRNFQAGDAVTFAVRITSGRPQAYALRAAPKSLVWLAGGDAEASPEAEGRGGDAKVHVGEIKSFSLVRGYGFIGCPELHGRFGRDVFIHQSQFEGLRVGDRVTFRVQVKKGQPQACDVAPAQAAQGQAQATPGQPSALPTGREVAAVDLAALNRKLARACASAQGESLEALAELLGARADANARDVTGQTPVMMAALNARHGERKCRLLVEHRADLRSPCSGAQNAVQWARERINPQFAALLESAERGEPTDYTLAMDFPSDDF